MARPAKKVARKTPARSAKKVANRKTPAPMPAEDLIQLPRFDSIGAVILGDRLLAAADAAKVLPRSIRDARDDLRGELAALREAAAARLAAAGAPDPDAVALADRALDDGWSALFSWLTGFSKLPGIAPEAAEARALLKDLYPDGLSFILLPYELEWGQSDERLSRIEGAEIGSRIHALGGKIFIDALAVAHKTYGLLLGLSRKPSGGTSRKPAPPLPEKLDRFAAALRRYAIRVTASVDLDDPVTADLANRLLAPLLAWRS